MILQTPTRTLTFPRRPLIMGILNLNDDSFSGDGKLDPGWALERTRELVEEGADIVDVGAESARTNRPAISEAEEIRRLAPYLEGFAAVARAAQPADADRVFPPLLSINTWRPAVAEAALAIAGDILNDMSGLPAADNARICAAAGCALVIMHTRGTPKVPHTHVAYRDVLSDMTAFFQGRIAMARAAGLADSRIVLDPGIDFAKQRDDNLTVYRHLDRIADLGFPILLPVSRKTVIGDVLGLPSPSDRDAGTISCIVSGARRGAGIFRVHNVRAARQAILTLTGILSDQMSKSEYRNPKQ